MRHPTEGTLRRLIDEPAGVSDADRRHVADCATCLAGVAAAREDAVLVGAALRTDDAQSDVDTAWRRLSAALPASGSTRASAPARGRRWRALVRRPVVAALAFGVVLTGAGAAAANDWL